MRFNPALVSSFLFASAFLSNGVMSEDIYAGSTLKADHGNYESISATFHAPFFFGPDPSIAVVGVMMDGFACETTLMAAVSFGDIEEPKQRWIAWYQWAPDGPRVPSDVPISVGDKITIVVRASSETSATVTIHNHTNNQSETNSLSPSPHPLCQNQATWFIATSEDSVLPNFGMVEIMGAKATGVATGTQEAGRGELWNMENHTTLITTSHSSDFSTLIFKQD